MSGVARDPEWVEKGAEALFNHFHGPRSNSKYGGHYTSPV